MGEWTLSAYELVRRIGEGGMAEVYLARDTRLGREVAVKVLETRLAERAGFRERFLREARVSAALDHPNIVPVYDFGESGVLYLVMPFVSGGSLQDLVKHGPMPPAQVASYGAQMADALAYAHQRSVVHRDVKPANMLIHEDGRLMLSDFGLAKILDASAPPTTRRGRPDAGTPEYMAPEQIEGRTDARADLYGLGVVLYLLLTGRLPFSGATSSAVMEGHLYRLPEPPHRYNPAISPAVERVVLRALAKHPDDRYQSASEMGAALLAALVAGNLEPLPFVSDSGHSPISPPPWISAVPATASRPLAPRLRSNVSMAPRGMTAPPAQSAQPSSFARAARGGPNAPRAVPMWSAPSAQESHHTGAPPVAIGTLTPSAPAAARQVAVATALAPVASVAARPARSYRLWMVISMLVVLLALVVALLMAWIQFGPSLLP